MLTALTIINTILLALALLYVVALLRSHADILRRLAVLEAGNGPAAIPPPPREPGPTAARDIHGVTLDGDAVQLSLGEGTPATLLAFLSSGCTACGPFWDGLRADGGIRPLEERVVIVTHDPARESRRRLRTLAPPGIELVMAENAWTEYNVPASPHFVLTDGSGAIRGRGSAIGWAQLLELVREDREDTDHADSHSARTTEQRARRAEQTLADAGIVPGHPSLYGGGAAVSDQNGFMTASEGP